MRNVNFFRCSNLGFVTSLVTLFLTSACSDSHMFLKDVNRLKEATYGKGSIAVMDPTNGDEHLRNGKALLKQAVVSSNELYFARSAFERASTIKVDDPEPYFLSGYTNYLLGNYEAAYEAFFSAALLEKTSDGWFLASLSALRNHHEIAAQTLYNIGLKAPQGRSVSLSAYMSDLYAGTSGKKTVAQHQSGGSELQFVCSGITDKVSENIPICSDNLQVDFFIVERSSLSSSSFGLDLLNQMQIGLNGTLIDYSRTSLNGSSSGGSWSSSNTNGVTVDIPSINYALSLASDIQSMTTVSSTPILKVRLGEDSKTFGGETVTLISAVDNGPDPTTQTAGVTITVNMSEFTHINATIHTAVEVSDFVSPVISGSYAQVTASSSTVEATGRVPYNSTFLIGSFDYSGRAGLNQGETGVKQLPILGAAFGKKTSKVKRKEIVVLATVRPPLEIGFDKETAYLDVLSKLSFNIANRAERRALLHKAPQVSEVFYELGLF